VAVAVAVREGAEKRKALQQQAKPHLGKEKKKMRCRWLIWKWALGRREGGFQRIRHFMLLQRVKRSHLGSILRVFMLPLATLS